MHAPDRHRALLLPLLLAALVAGVAAGREPAGNIVPGQATPSQETEIVMSTFSIPHDIVKNIVGNAPGIEIHYIVPDGQDIHAFEPAAGSVSMTRLAQANLLFAMGPGEEDGGPLPAPAPGGIRPAQEHEHHVVEAWLEDTLASLGASAPEVVHLIEHDMLKADPNLDGQENLHAWMDPRNVKAMASTVTLALMNHFNSGTLNATFQANNATYQARLDAVLATIEGNKSTLAGLKVVTWHPAFMYLLDLLEVNETAVMEKLEGQEPTSAYVHQVITMMARENVNVVVTQPQIPQAGVENLAREAGARLAMLTPLLGIEGKDGRQVTTYAGMIEYNIWALLNPYDPPPAVPGYETWIMIAAAGVAAVLLAARTRRA